MELSEREETLIDQIACNLYNRGLCISDNKDPDYDPYFDMVKAELSVFMRHAKKLVYDEISDLLLNHSLQFKEIKDNMIEKDMVSA